MNNFSIENNKIYSNVSGDLVAVISDDGTIKIQPGKNAMTPRIKAFYEEYKKSNLPMADEQTGGTAILPMSDEQEAGTVTLPMSDEQKAGTVTLPMMSPLPQEDEEEVNTAYLQERLDNPQMTFGDAPRQGTSAPPAEEKTENKKVLQQLAVWDIPKSELPRLDVALGVYTPEFKEFVKKHNLTKEQAAELVNRIERNM